MGYYFLLTLPAMGGVPGEVFPDTPVWLGREGSLPCEVDIAGR